MNVTLYVCCLSRYLGNASAYTTEDNVFPQTVLNWRIIYTDYGWGPQISPKS